MSEREGGTVNLVDAPHRFLSVPGTADLPVGITRVEEAPQPDLAPVAVSSRGPRSGAGMPRAIAVATLRWLAPLTKHISLASSKCELPNSPVQGGLAV